MGFSMGLANNKLQLIRSTTATGTQWQQQQQQTGVGGGVSRALQTCVCLWTLINAFEAFMQMAGNNLSPIQDATAAATATVAAAATIAMDTTTTATTATIIKPSIQALQYAKVLFISVTPTQLALSGRGHTFSRKVFLLLLLLFFALCLHFISCCCRRLRLIYLCWVDFIVVASHIIRT